VHLKDIHQRQSECYNITGFNIENLVNSSSINTTWYKLDKTNLRKQWEVAAKPCISLKRKFVNAFRPYYDWEQMVYFVIPWIVLYILTAKESLKDTTPIHEKKQPTEQKYS
jgi:hypothetical protein